MLGIIKSEQEYDRLLGRAYELMQLDLLPDAQESDELELITLLIEHYESKRYQIMAPTPINAIKFRLEQLGKPESELSKILGARSRQSEILSGKRKLNLSMIRKLNKALNIPLQSLIAEY